MRMSLVLVGALCLALLAGGDRDDVASRAQRYLVDLIRLDTTNPPGNESRVAKYLKKIADEEGIPAELLGSDPARLNFVARLKGKGSRRPLLLMAHSDVVPADPSQWTVPAFAAELRDGRIYGRGAQDDKSLLAAELAVMVELKRRGTPLARDIILVSEADEEAGSTGILWLIRNAWSKIDAEFALNEGGFAMDVAGGPRVFQIQTSEKVPTRVVLKARGTAGHGSLPRSDNAVVHLARAITRIAESDQPVRMNSTTKRYFDAISKLPGYEWLAPLSPRLHDAGTATSTANQIREHDAELDAQLRTTISPTMLHAGMKVNVIPNSAEAQLDIRRLPNETPEEIFARLRKIINDSAVEVTAEGGQQMPSTEPSSMTTTLYKKMEQVFIKSVPKAVVIPYMQRGATDGSFLRQKGMAVYGVPVFLREDKENRAHGNDERISTANLARGTGLLWEIVSEVAK